jgi:hypothetical protein
MWPLTLVLSIFLAGAIGGGVGALLVSPPQQAGLVSELRSLLASYQHTSPPTPQMTESDSSAAYSEPSANPRRGSEPIASEMPTAPSETPGYLLVDNHGASEAARTEPDNEAPRRAPVAVEISATPSDTANGTPEYPPIDNPGPSDIARAETDDEAPRTPPLAVETSTSSSNPVSTTPEYPPIDNQGASDVAETAHADETPGSAPIAVDMPATPSNPVNTTPESLPVDNHGVSDNARIAMERGDERMRRGDVASARRFYETAAATGMIEAATAIGRTFDPLYLKRIGVRGALADARRAKQWYEKAARAGDMEAQARIELMTFDRSNQ